MEIYVNGGQFFAVPAAVADHFLGLASHDQLKVLLYILCHNDKNLIDTEISAACKVRADAVEEALVFWQNVNVLQNQAPAAVCHVTREQPQTESENQADTKESEDTPPAAEVRPKPPLRTEVSSVNYHMMPSEIAERMEQNQAMAEMIAAAQSLTGDMNYTLIRSVFWMNEYLGLAPDLILMLIAFCIQINSFNVRYLEQVAVEWSERGITTHELADEDITRRTQAREFTGKVMRIFEMKRKPVPKQQVFIDEWEKNAVPLELIELAYQTGRYCNDDRVSFPFIDSILKRWQEAGYRTAAEAAAADEAFREEHKKNKNTPKKKQAAGRSEQADAHSFDVHDFEKLMNQF